MISVFEKAILSLLFYTQNHSFIAHDFFLQNVYSNTISLLFYGRDLRAYYMYLQLSTCTGSTEEGPSRHNWKIIDWKLKELIQTKKSQI